MAARTTTWWPRWSASCPSCWCTWTTPTSRRVAAPAVAPGLGGGWLRRWAAAGKRVLAAAMEAGLHACSPSLQERSLEQLLPSPHAPP